MPDNEEIEHDFLDFEEGDTQSINTSQKEGTLNSQLESAHEHRGTTSSNSSDHSRVKPMDDDLLQKAEGFFCLPEVRSSKAKRGIKRRRSSSSSEPKTDGNRPE